VNAWRAPILVVLIGLLATGVVLQRRQDEAAAGRTPAVEVDRLMPVAAPAGAPSSTWFCAGGTAIAGAEGVADHEVTVANTSTVDVEVTLTAYPSSGEPRSRTETVEAGTRADTALRDLVTAPWAAATVEVDGGEVAVAHTVRGVDGRATAPCAAAPAGRWYFPGGATRRGAREVLTVFNPFPDDAVVDIGFETDDGSRSPTAYQALVVPAGRVLPVDITEVVTVRTEVAATVSVRAGRVVTDQVQIWNGTDGQARGIGLTLGATGPVETWAFPGGAQLVEGSDVTESYVLFNPGDRPATALVQVRTDDAARRGIIEPYEVTVRPRQYTVVSLAQDDRVPVDVGRWAQVFTTDGPPIVAERVVQARGGAPEKGVSYAMGSPLQASRWIVPAAAAPGVAASRISILNPSSATGASVTVTAVHGDERGPVEGFDGRQVPAGEQIELDATRLPDADATSLVIDASAPVVVAQELITVDPADRSEAMAVPVAGTASLLPRPSVVPAGALDPATGTPGSTPGLDGEGTVPLPSPAGTAPSTTAPPTTTTVPASDAPTTTTTATPGAPASSETSTTTAATVAPPPP
jgi:hypothetical protein